LLGAFDFFFLLLFFLAGGCCDGDDTLAAGEAGFTPLAEDGLFGFTAPEETGLRRTFLEGLWTLEPSTEAGLLALDLSVDAGLLTLDLSVDGPLDLSAEVGLLGSAEVGLPCFGGWGTLCSMDGTSAETTFFSLGTAGFVVGDFEGAFFLEGDEGGDAILFFPPGEVGLEGAFFLLGEPFDSSDNAADEGTLPVDRLFLLPSLLPVLPVKNLKSKPFFLPSLGDTGLETRTGLFGDLAAAGDTSSVATRPCIWRRISANVIEKA
jgi:hypothetical protein